MTETNKMKHFKRGGTRGKHVKNNINPTEKSLCWFLGETVRWLSQKKITKAAGGWQVPAVPGRLIYGIKECNIQGFLLLPFTVRGPREKRRRPGTQN